MHLCACADPVNTSLTLSSDKALSNRYRLDALPDGSGKHTIKRSDPNMLHDNTVSQALHVFLSMPKCNEIFLDSQNLWLILRIVDADIPKLLAVVS